MDTTLQQEAKRADSVDSRVRISLAQKFFVLVAGLLSLAIACYVALATHLFNSDKTAFIYSESAALSETLAAEVASRLDSFIKTLRFVGLTKAEDDKADLQAWINADRNLLDVALYDVKDLKRSAPIGSLKPSVYLVNQERVNMAGLSTNVLRKSPAGVALTRETLGSDLWIGSRATLGRVSYITVALGLRDSGKSSAKRGPLRIVIGRMIDEGLIQVFSRSALYDSILLNRDGYAILASERRLAKDTASYSRIVRNIVTAGIRSGVREYAGAAGPMIYSFTKIDHGQLVVVSEIAREKAYLASKQLVYRSVLFACLVFLIGAIAARVFILRLTASLRDLFAATLRIGKGNFETPVNPTTKDEVGALGHSFNHMTLMIRRLLSETADKARMEKELETAQAVQSYLLPAKTRPLGDLGIFPFYRSASETGGDWWGHYVVRPHEELIFLGDVVGHGVSAALVTAMIHAACNIEVERIRESDEPIDLANILRRLNRLLFNSMAGEMCMTLFAAHIDTQKMTLNYANSGHVQPILVPKRADDQRLKSNRRHFVVVAPSDPLGISPDPFYQNLQLSMRPGDRFLLYSDGIYECRSVDGSQWGKKNFVRALDKRADLIGVDLCKQLVEDAFNFFGTMPLDDDVSLVVIELPTQNTDESADGGGSSAVLQSAS